MGCNLIRSSKCFSYDRTGLISPFCNGAGAVGLTSGFTNGPGLIWLSNVQCRGTETTLTYCPRSSFGVNYCSHIEDAGVMCFPCTQGAIRLQRVIRLQGGTATYGRVEICISNVWGTVCDGWWSTTDAQVACRQLGYAVTGTVSWHLFAIALWIEIASELSQYHNPTIIHLMG